jgi:hypothetical protein
VHGNGEQGKDARIVAGRCSMFASDLNGRFDVVVGGVAVEEERNVGLIQRP